MIVAGTLIGTPGGAVAAETLRPGDAVLALENGQPVARPLRSVYRLDIAPDRHPMPARVLPLRVMAGALAPGVPSRDLLLSPDHPVFVEGALFQAQSLGNGASIAQPAASGTLAYIHLELGRHGLLLAEGVAVASYLDTGDRSQFAGGVAMPDLATTPTAAALAVWTANGCTKLRLDIAAIRPVHAALAARAGTLGWRMSADPAVVVLADASAVPLARFAAGHMQARLPGGTRVVCLYSRSFAPADHDPASGDRRRLGLAVRAVRLNGQPMPADALGSGWYPPEAAWRWTNGDALIILPPLAAAATLELRSEPAAVAGYWVAPT
jgi:hypothetical protein